MLVDTSGKEFILYTFLSHGECELWYDWQILWIWTWNFKGPWEVIHLYCLTCAKCVDMKSYFILVLLKSFSLRIQLRLTQKDKLERKVAKEKWNKLASSKMRKLKSWQALQADKLTSWKFASYQTDRWKEYLMTRWKDDMVKW